MKAGAAAVLLITAAGCGRAILPPPVPRQLFVAKEAQEPAPRVPCPDYARRFVEAQRSLKEGPPPIPGEDGSPILVRVSVESRLAEVVALRIDRLNPYFPLYVGFAEGAPLAAVQLDAGSAPALSARALVKMKIKGGLFDDLSYCYDVSAAVTLWPGDGGATLVIRDGAPGNYVPWVTLEAPPRGDADDDQDGAEDGDAAAAPTARMMDIERRIRRLGTRGSR